MPGGTSVGSADPRAPLLGPLQEWAWARESSSRSCCSCNANQTAAQRGSHHTWGGRCALGSSLVGRPCGTPGVSITALQGFPRMEPGLNAGPEGPLRGPT